jgi:DNA-binding transcriptional MerR regulator
VIPNTCTLPVTEHPSRLAEFDALLSRAHAWERRAPEVLRLVLEGGRDTEAAAVELAGRESSCCPFFTFTITRSGERVEVDVTVPATERAVLDAMQLRAGVPHARTGKPEPTPVRDVTAGKPSDDRPRDPTLQPEEIATPTGAPPRTETRLRTGEVTTRTDDPPDTEASLGAGRPLASRLRTGEVAARAGVGIQTLRYYERRGLLPRPGRGPGGHRAYPPETVDLVRTIKSAQRLGFTLSEIARLLDHRRPGLHEPAVTKLAEIDARIQDLTTVRRTLAAVVAAGCDDLTNCTSPACPRFPHRA